MIDSVEIKNFKNLLNFEIKRISPITLIGGSNNIGKSNLLEAIFLEYLKQSKANVTYIGPRNIVNPNNDSNKFGQLDLVKQEIVIEALKIIEPRLKSLSSSKSIIHVDIGIGKKIPLHFMGNGLLRLLSIILSIVTNENGILLIDEFENGIHYSSLCKIWNIIAKLSNKFKCQLIVTTHSYECINAATEGIDSTLENNFCYIRLFKNRENIIDKHIFKIDELRTSLSYEWEVR